MITDLPVTNGTYPVLIHLHKFCQLKGVDCWKCPLQVQKSAYGECTATRTRMYVGMTMYQWIEQMIIQED